MHRLPIQCAFESNRLLHSIAIDFKFFSCSVYPALHNISVI